MVNALVAKAEEGRGRQRNRLGNRQQVMIQSYPNAETPPDASQGNPSAS